MAPQYSALSIGAYRQNLEEAIQSVGNGLTSSFIESWGTEPDYLNGIAVNIHQTLARFPDEEREQVKVVFTAHSLPAFILERGDPYDAQLRETASLLAEQLELPADRRAFCYQSAAQTGTPWLGPSIEEFVPSLAAQGERTLVIAPIGFIADHVEVLYDLDIGVQKIASEHEVHVERTPMLNDSEPLIAALVSLVQTHL
jgi:ferrochelatase